jgi:hypothetical protein
MENKMQKLIIDKVTGTVLNIEGCYVIDADQLDDSFTDSEIADLADRSGLPIVGGVLDTTLELINKLWFIMHNEQDSDLVVGQICALLNEAEAQIKLEKGQQ